MTRRPCVRWRHQLRALCVAAVASGAVPQVSAAQPSLEPLRRQESNIYQVPRDKAAKRWQVDILLTDYKLQCTAKATTGCTLETPIKFHEETVKVINKVADGKVAWLEVCSHPAGWACADRVPWSPTQHETDLSGHGLACSRDYSVDYYLSWTLRTLPHAALSNPLKFNAGSRDACPGTP